MSTRIFLVETSNHDLVFLKVDTSIFTDKVAREINEYHDGGKDRLSKTNNDVIAAVIRLLGGLCIHFMRSEGGARILNVGTYADAWLDCLGANLVEGWPHLKKHGIQILAANVRAIDKSKVNKP